MSFTFNGIAQILVYFVLLLLITKPMGLYLTAVFNGRRTWLGYVFRPVERVIYKICGVDEEREQDWKVYTVSMLLFSAGHGMLLLYADRAAARPCCQATPRASPPSIRCSPSTPPSASRPTPTGRTTPARRR